MTEAIQWLPGWGLWVDEWDGGVPSGRALASPPCLASETQPVSLGTRNLLPLMRVTKPYCDTGMVSHPEMMTYTKSIKPLILVRFPKQKLVEVCIHTVPRSSLGCLAVVAYAWHTGSGKAPRTRQLKLHSGHHQTSCWVSESSLNTWWLVFLQGCGKVWCVTASHTPRALATAGTQQQWALGQAAGVEARQPPSSWGLWAPRELEQTPVQICVSNIRQSTNSEGGGAGGGGNSESSDLYSLSTTTRETSGFLWWDPEGDRAAFTSQAKSLNPFTMVNETATPRHGW